MKLTPESALVLVDLQRDFLAGGAVAVPRGDDVIAAANRLAEGFTAVGLPVVVTRLWRPAQSRSFEPQGGRWPVHAVQGTPGAELSPDFRQPDRAWVISTGTTPDSEGWSAFENTDLASRLRSAGVQTLYVAGLPTEHAVKQTVLDAAREGFEVVMVADACRGLNAHVGDSARAVEEMLQSGARIASSGAVDNALEAYTPAG
jgi:nicotinamidase/pyrazinamidase